MKECEAVKKLTKSEFYTTYGISLLADKVEEADQEFLVALLQPIAEHYRDITLYALRDELRYFIRGGSSEEDSTTSEYMKGNRKVLRRFGISSFRREVRLSLDIDTIIHLFADGTWHGEYGGDAWAGIAEACKELMKLLPASRFNIKKVVSAIDILNDLEHNNDLYLSEFSEFKLYETLDKKFMSAPREIFAESSSDVQKLAKEYRGILK